MPKNYRNRKGRGQGETTERFIRESDQDSRRNDYYEHDGGRGNDGGRRNANGPKGGRIDRHRQRQTVSASRIRNQLDNDDVEMGGGPASASGQPRFSPYGQRGGRYGKNRGPRPLMNGRQQHSGGPGWNRICINQGARYAKDYILKTLLNATAKPFIPVYYHVEGKNAVFYVEDSEAALALRQVDRQITLDDGLKLSLLTNRCPPPSLPINDELKERIKLVMNKRYNLATRALSLSKFHLDDDLREDFYCPLSRDNVMQCVVGVLISHVPGIVALDLSDNKLFNLDQLRPLINVTVNLKSLNLTNNKLNNALALDKLEGLSLEELCLEGNPLCDRIQDQSTYVSAVRKRFPKVIRLDGVELPPPISFDLDAEDTKIAPSTGSFFVSDSGRQVAVVFLDQYFALYDSNNRQPLVDAYHDQANFSLTCGYPANQSAATGNKLGAYMSGNRNLKRADDARRLRLLHQGKVAIVAFLGQLPATQHDPASLIVDVPVSSTHLMVLSVRGVFKEREERYSIVRSFHRVFVIMPLNGGYCIVNEELFVTVASTQQIKASFKAPDPTPSSSPNPHAHVVTSSVGTATVGVSPLLVTSPVAQVANPAVRQEMIAAFAAQSGMNLDWSVKCLEENGWDFEKAAFVFTELSKAGQIPPDAFVK